MIVPLQPRLEYHPYIHTVSTVSHLVSEAFLSLTQAKIAPLPSL